MRRNGARRVADQLERRVNSPKPRMGKAKDRVSRVLEEWLAEAKIRYTHAGD